MQLENKTTRHQTNSKTKTTHKQNQPKNDHQTQRKETWLQVKHPVNPSKSPQIHSLLLEPHIVSSAHFTKLTGQKNIRQLIIAAIRCMSPLPYRPVAIALPRQKQESKQCQSSYDTFPPGVGQWKNYTRRLKGPPPCRLSFPSPSAGLAVGLSR